MMYSNKTYLSQINPTYETEGGGCKGRRRGGGMGYIKEGGEERDMGYKGRSQG